MTSFPFSDTRKESEMVLEVAKFLLTTLQKPALPFLVLLPVCATAVMAVVSIACSTFGDIAE